MSKKVHIRHILVQQAYEISDLLRKLEAGEDFAELAKSYSLCSSSAQGGDLGVIQKGQTVREFEQAAFKLKVDEISGPVKTQFGHHLIQRLP